MLARELVRRLGGRVEAAEVSALLPRQDRVGQGFVAVDGQGVFLHGGDISEIGAGARGPAVVDLEGA